ncbi:DUF29 domain-containing protein [Thiocystis violacea]|uniref:DUF29 domain-containing protein n=1 Tax=Thiocystis violacea TaxID=13725 RepID=UPI001908A5EF|nr:DUF29 domain-containing protein [Thiocystis violacea]MBK1725340.1 hypothetical protein [Thiocystis violacea]
MQPNLHDTDRLSCLEQQVHLLQTDRLGALDIEHLTEELEAEMGNERRELYRRLRILIGHLLNWHYQPEQHSSSWAGTIRVQRKDILKLLKGSPSLKRFIEEEIREAHQDTVDLTSFETGIDTANFPADCLYSIEDLLNADYWP